MLTTDVVGMWSHRSRVGPQLSDWYPYKKMVTWVQRHTVVMKLCDNWSYATASQRLPDNNQKLERGKEGFPYSFQTEPGLANTLILDFSFQIYESNFCCLSYWVFGILSQQLYKTNKTCIIHYISFKNEKIKGMLGEGKQRDVSWGLRFPSYF
jgi:hypothetical protein